MNDERRTGTGEGAVSRRTILRGVAVGIAGAAVGSPASGQSGEVEQAAVSGATESSSPAEDKPPAGNLKKRTVKGYVSPLYALDFELPG